MEKFTLKMTNTLANGHKDRFTHFASWFAICAESANMCQAVAEQFAKQQKLCKTNFVESMLHDFQQSAETWIKDLCNEFSEIAVHEKLISKWTKDFGFNLLIILSNFLEKNEIDEMISFMNVMNSAIRVAEQNQLIRAQINVICEENGVEFKKIMKLKYPSLKASHGLRVLMLNQTVANI